MHAVWLFRIEPENVEWTSQCSVVILVKVWGKVVSKVK